MIKAIKEYKEVSKIMKEYSFVFKMDDNLEKYYRNKSDDVKLQAMKKRIQAIQDIIMKFENFLN